MPLAQPQWRGLGQAGGTARLNVCHALWACHTGGTVLNPAGAMKKGDPEVARWLLSHGGRQEKTQRVKVKEVRCNDIRGTLVVPQRQ